MENIPTEIKQKNGFAAKVGDSGALDPPVPERLPSPSGPQLVSVTSFQQLGPPSVCHSLKVSSHTLSCKVLGP